MMIEGQKSVLFEVYDNWTPVEVQLEVEARMAIAAALIMGRGRLRTELYLLPGTR